MKRFAVELEGITYGYIAEGRFKDRRWELVYPIVDGKVSMDITKILPKKHSEGGAGFIVTKQIETIAFGIDIDNRKMTRSDGTVFKIVEIED
ncbi:hypothetical protein QMA77_18780 [Pantoea ananatis]|uniref:hypothetical protein n=1 Tax=Pantoea ananas TaxID=553 RepID=UPI002360ADD5|nr:hypothetical protein [Pantoea ananatis]MDI6538972.1 hypothetical protein [Pantoea ananatis]